MDKESNLADYGVRKYENEVGVFTSIDPLWEQYRSWTPYHYSRNNPIMRLDPSGFADYYDYDGHVGNDGVDDGERYAVIPYQGYNRNKPDFDIIKNGGQSFKFPSDRMIYEIMCLLYNEVVKPGPIFEHTEAAGSIGIDLNSQSEYFIFGGINNNKPSNYRYLAEATKEIEYANSILKNLGFIHFYDVHTHPYSDDWFGESFLPSGIDGKEGDMVTARRKDQNGIVLNNIGVSFYSGSAFAKIPIQEFINIYNQQK